MALDKYMGTAKKKEERKKEEEALSILEELFSKQVRHDLQSHTRSHTLGGGVKITLLGLLPANDPQFAYPGLIGREIRSNERFMTSKSEISNEGKSALV